jgi:hypothetical protein
VKIHLNIFLVRLLQANIFMKIQQKYKNNNLSIVLINNNVIILAEEKNSDGGENKMKITKELVDSLVFSLEKKTECENARFMIENVVKIKAEEQNCSLGEIIQSFENENKNTDKYQLYYFYQKMIGNVESKNLVSVK